MNEQIEDEIKNLKNESDDVFRKIVEKMAEFYNDIEEGTVQIKN